MTGQGAYSFGGDEVRFRDVANDTIVITRLLTQEASHRDAPRLDRIALELVGIPYGEATLENDDKTPEGEPKEVLTVGMDSLDCTTFVETALALAYTVGEGRQGWQDFVYNLRRFRYRNGQTDGYCSRLHYPSAWILDCAGRGLVREATSDFPEARYRVKTLDFMSHHRGAYAAMADSVTFEKIKDMEAGLRSYRYPVLKGGALGAKSLARILRSGDVVCFTTSQPGLDINHMGIVVIDPDGTPRLVHASSKHGQVCVDPLPLADYIRRNRNEGIRIVRLTL